MPKKASAARLSSDLPLIPNSLLFATGQMSLVRIRAKSLISNRNSVQKFYTMGAQLQGLGLRLTTMASTSVMTDAMKVIFTNIFLHLYLTIPLAGRVLGDVSAQRGARPAQNPAVRYIPQARLLRPSQFRSLLQDCPRFREAKL